jgi:hypothetical protein
MGILKQAKIMTITVTEDYTLMVEGKLEKTAQKMNIESTKEILVFNSNKKIVSHGNKK